MGMRSGASRWGGGDGAPHTTDGVPVGAGLTGGRGVTTPGMTGVGTAAVAVAVVDCAVIAA